MTEILDVSLAVTLAIIKRCYEIVKLQDRKILKVLLVLLKPEITRTRK